MLVLTRRTGESIVIGNDIVVTVLEVRHDQVRIGIDAPRAVQVHREEVFNQVMAENTAAVAAAADRANPLLRRPVTAKQPPPRKGPRLQPGRPPVAGAAPAAPPAPAPKATPVAPASRPTDEAPAADASAPAAESGAGGGHE